jgi:hypothetical protein
MIKNIDDFKVGGLYICKSKGASCPLVCLDGKYSVRDSHDVPILILEILKRLRKILRVSDSIRCKVLIKDTIYFLWMWTNSYEKCK